MEKNKAVLHTQKGSGSGGGIGNHIDRTKGMEHTYENANKERIHLNEDYTPSEYKNLSIPKCIEKSIKKNYTAKTKTGKVRKIRNDSVKYITNILSGSPEQMEKIFSDKRMRNEWIEENLKFMKNEFGAKNIIRFVLHLDEKTPHIHCVTTPITKDGRLSAREMVGNQINMTQRQDRYAVLMKRFGLERGVKNSNAKHETAKEYKRRISRFEKDTFKTDLEPIKGVFNVKKDKTIEKHVQTIKDYQKSITTLESDIDKVLMNKNKREKENEILRKGLDPLKNKISALELLMINERKEKATAERKLLRILKYDSILDEERKRRNIKPQPKKTAIQLYNIFVEERTNEKLTPSNIEDVTGFKLSNSQYDELDDLIEKIKGNNLNQKY